MAAVGGLTAVRGATPPRAALLPPPLRAGSPPPARARSPGRGLLRSTARGPPAAAPERRAAGSETRRRVKGRFATGGGRGGGVGRAVCSWGDEGRGGPGLRRPQPRRGRPSERWRSDPQTGVAPGGTRGRKVRSKCR